MFDSLTVGLDLDAKKFSAGIENAISGAKKLFDKMSGTKMNWGDIMNVESLRNLNWSALVSEIFSPANLVLFFSAMAGLGIAAASTIQNLAAQTTGQLGLFGNQGATGLQFVNQAQSILAQVGTQAGGLKDVNAALETFYVITGNLGDSVKIVTELDKALATTGGTLSASVSPLADFLQNAKVTDLAGIQTVISSLELASQEAGPMGGGMAGILNVLSPLGVAAGVAGQSVKTLSEEMAVFGEDIAKQGISNATAQVDVFSSALTGSNKNLIALVGTAGQFESAVTSEGPAKALLDLDKKVQNVSGSTKELIASFFGISEQALDAATGSSLIAPFLETAQKKADALGSGVGIVNAEFQKTDTLTREISRTWSAFQLAVAKFVETPEINDLLKAMMWVLNEGTTFFNWMSNNMGSLTQPAGNGIAGMGGLGSFASIIGGPLFDLFGSISKALGGNTPATPATTPTPTNITIHSTVQSGTTAAHQASQQKHIQKNLYSGFTGVSSMPSGASSSALRIGGLGF